MTDVSREPDPVPGPEPLTALTISNSAALLVREVCTCGGGKSRRAWRRPGDLRNHHDPECPAIGALSRLQAVVSEAVAARPSPDEPPARSDWTERATLAGRARVPSPSARPSLDEPPKMCGNSDHAHFDEWVRSRSAEPPVADLRPDRIALALSAAGFTPGRFTESRYGEAQTPLNSRSFTDAATDLLATLRDPAPFAVADREGPDSERIVAYIRGRVRDEPALAWPGEIDDILDDAMLLVRDSRWSALKAETPEPPRAESLCDCGHGSPHYARPYRLAARLSSTEDRTS